MTWNTTHIYNLSDRFCLYVTFGPFLSLGFWIDKRQTTLALGPIALDLSWD